MFDPNQQKIGIGDISLVGIVEFGPFFNTLKGLCFSLEAAQIGLNKCFAANWFKGNRR